jgi:hypothetical protein
MQNPFRRFWESDRGLTALLIVLVVMIFIVPASGLAKTTGRIVIDALFTLLMIAGVSAVTRQRIASRVMVTIAAAGLVLRWLGQFSPSPSVEAAVALSGVASVATLAYLVLSQVFRAGAVTKDRIMGAIAVYLLLGLAWGEAFQSVEHLNPGSFSTAASVPINLEGWTYYSFVTLTTVGYGDITPLSSLARSLAILEALTGQLYPAILLARLVALEVGSTDPR